jgi:hypothetical protein
VNLLLYLWYQNRLLFSGALLFSIFSGLSSIFGMLNIGPLSGFLYKQSVTSRGEFMRTAITGANDNPILGVGLDSFGDVSQFYKSAKDYAGINEFTDNAHNYFLEFAATGGYPLAILNLLIVFLTLYSFISLQKKLGKFDAKLSSIFCAWIVFQMQSLISPGTITLIVWGAILSGFFIGSNIKYVIDHDGIKKTESKPKFITQTTSVCLLIVGLLIMFPLYKTDKDLKKGIALKNGDMVIKSLTAYPESSVKYNVFTQEFLKSNLLPQVPQDNKLAAPTQ